MDTNEEKPRKIPLRDIAAAKSVRAQSRNKTKGLSFWTYFWLCLLGVLLFFLAPVPTFLLSLFPEQWIRQIAFPHYTDVVLVDQSTAFSDAVKLSRPEPLPVVGHDTGLCFVFYATQQNPNAAIIARQALKNAYHGKPIAEIIAVDAQKREYELRAVTLEQDDDVDQPFSLICQKLGRRYSIIPKTITAVYVRPLQEFTPFKVVWVSTKSLR